MVDKALTVDFADELVNTAFLLYEGPLAVTRNGNTQMLNGAIRLAFAPHQSFVFELTGPLGVLEVPGSFPETVSIELPQSEGKGSGKIWSSKFDSGAPATQILYGHLDDEFRKGNPCATDEIRFCVSNFPSFIGTAISYPKKHSASRLLVQSKEYEIVLDEVPELPFVLERLSSEGGFGITHLGRVRRIDSKPIEYEEAIHLTETLTWWLSLLRGERTGPILVSGVHGGLASWEFWRTPGVHPWQGPKSWLPGVLNDTSITEPLGVIFDSLNRSPAPLLKSMHRLIDWYTQSQRGEHTGAIVIMAQAGLELAAWLSVVGELGMSEDGFEKLTAADQLRVAMNFAKIDTEVPVSLPSLHSDCASMANRQELDGPAAITEFRNGTVHPKSVARFSSFESEFQCDQLAIRLLELLILHKLGYQGKMKDRTHPSGDEALVPWAN